MEKAFEGVADSLQAGASVTSPGASATICNLLPPAGRYRVKVAYMLSGTAETALQNIGLLYNGTTMSVTMPTISGAGWVTVEMELTLNGVNSVVVRSQAAATVGAVYSAAITATRLE